jgi:hypothetical protein
MTLILSEASRFGVVMVGDSAITSTPNKDLKLPSGSSVPEFIRLGAQKVKAVKNKPIGISFWGMGRIGNVPTDIWIDDFIDVKSKDINNLDEFCYTLADEVNKDFFKHMQDDVGGFHIGSILDINSDAPIPVLYHIHRGHPGEKPGKFNLYKDIPNSYGLEKKSFLENLMMGNTFFIRNGFHESFAKVQNRILDSILDLNRTEGLDIPYPPNLKSQEKFNRLLVGLMCDLFTMSNHIASVGRPISSLTIDLKGNVTFSSALSDVSYV